MQGKEYKLLPLTLNIETLGGVATPLVLRGTILPTIRNQVFSTAADNQESVEVKVLIGESPIAKKNKVVGTFSLKGIPPAPRGKPQIMVTYEVDKNLKIIVNAIEQATQTKMEVLFDMDQIDLSDDELINLLKEHEISRLEDEVLLKSIELKNNAEVLLHNAEKELRENQEKGIKGANDKTIEKLIASLGLALESNKNEDIKFYYDKLNLLITTQFNLGGIGDIFDSFFSTTKNNVQQKPVKKQNSVPFDKISPSKIKSYNLGKVFGGGDFTLDPNLCFVLMPFNTLMSPIYEDHIKPTVIKEGLACLRADELLGNSTITFDIWEKINRARLLIADMTNKNPNVFYELGLAHALGKDVILLTQSMDDVPFDLKSLRCIIYSYDPRGAKKLEEQLQASIKYYIQSS